MLFSPMDGQTLGADGATFVIAEWSQEGTPAGDQPMPVAPHHRHLDEDEAWYVLEGALCIEVGGGVFRAEAGSAVHAPKGTVHTYWNPDPAPARYLLIMGRQTHDLIQAIHAATDRSREAMQALFARHRAELA